MKKLLLSLTLLAGLGLAASAQTNQVKFGIKAGVSFPNMSFSATGISESGDMTTSFYVGGTVNIPVDEMFSVQPGLTYIGKGTQQSGSMADILGDDASGNGKVKINPFYLELPVNLIAHFKAGEGKFFVGAGPYYAIGIGGKVKVKGTDGVNSGEVKGDIKYGDGETFKRGDFGVNFLTGYELSNGFNIHAGYGLGLSNVFNTDLAKAKHRVLSVGVGYTF